MKTKRPRKTCIVHARVDPDVRRWLEDLAATRRESMSVVTRSLIVEAARKAGGVL